MKNRQQMKPIWHLRNIREHWEELIKVFWCLDYQNPLLIAILIKLGRISERKLTAVNVMNMWVKKKIYKQVRKLYKQLEDQSLMESAGSTAT